MTVFVALPYGEKKCGKLLNVKLWGMGGTMSLHSYKMTQVLLYLDTTEYEISALTTTG